MTDSAAPAQFEHWSVVLDQSATAAAYNGVSGIDASCCNACATWLRALETREVPDSVLAFFAAAGIDPTKPYTVWGAPESGVLSGFLLFRGLFLSPDWDGSAEAAVAEPRPGFKCWLTRSTAAPPESFKGLGLVQIEFHWESTDLVAIESAAWTNPIRRGT